MTKVLTRSALNLFTFLCSFAALTLRLTLAFNSACIASKALDQTSIQG